MKQKKTIILLAAMALIIGIAAGSTLAWLTDATADVKNVFTPSDISITLTESENLDLQMVPGYTITKDPKVTVKANSEKCYLFVKISKSANYTTFLDDYAVEDGWTVLAGETDVYYRVVDESDADKEFYVIKDNKLTVKTSVTKSEMQTISSASNQPTLTVTAYASQYNKNNTDAFTEAEAWANISGS